MAAALLPFNRSRLEADLAGVGSTTTALPIPISELKNVAAIPERLLSYLAAELSVDIWNDDWPEHKKRSTIASAIELHRLKGTEEGIRRHLNLADSELVRTIVPPGKFFLSIAQPMTPEREARMPQLRIYERTERGAGVGQLFLGVRRRQSFLGARCFADSGASVRGTPRIVFWERGVETEVSIETIITLYPGLGRIATERLLLKRAKGPRATYLGGPLRTLSSIDSLRNVATFRRSIGGTRFLRRGLTPSSIDPEIVTIPGNPRLGYFFGRGLSAGRYFVNGRPKERTYQRITLLDPSLAVRNTGASFFGASRFGQPDYTADLYVHVPGHRRRREFGTKSYFGGVFSASTGDKYRRALDAIRVSKSARDALHINTKTFRSPTAGNLIVAGTPFIAGRLLRS